MKLIGEPTHQEQAVAGGTVKVVQAPRFRELGAVATVAAGAASLWQGMKVTFGYLANPKTVATQQYPENRDTLAMTERYRARLIAVVDENGYHKCTACEACQNACPNYSIQVKSRKAADGKKDEIDYLLWRLDSCTFCNSCVQVCPWGAIEFTGEFESSVYDRRLLVYNLIPYAGPPAKELAKIADPAERQAVMQKRPAYDAPVPMHGAAMAGVAPLPLAQPAPAPIQQEEAPHVEPV